MSGLDLAKRRLFSAAKLSRIRTAVAEIAALRQIDGTGHIALQKNTLSLTLDRRVGDRDGRKKCLCVRVAVLDINILTVRHLDKRTQIHNGNTV